MSADQLRAAATALRGLAEAATPGPWERAWGAVRGPEQRAIAAPRHDDAGYIAAVHPGVGRALADLLDSEADQFDDTDRTVVAGEEIARLILEVTS